MKKNTWDEREKAFEDKYFHDLEREQLRKLREKNAPCATGDSVNTGINSPIPEVKKRKS